MWTFNSRFLHPYDNNNCKLRMSKKETAAWVTNGASNVSKSERQFADYYSTPPDVTRQLLQNETFNKHILEPCCGGGHIVKVLVENGYSVMANDLYDHGFACSHKEFISEIHSFNGDIITNPPYEIAQEFVEHALEIIPEGNKVAMLLRLSFLEGKKRSNLFKNTPPYTVYVSISRIRCGIGDDFSGTSAVAYAWFVWVKGYKGSPQIKWFN